MKDKFNWHQEDNGELYIRCKHCLKLYVWKAYKPSNLKGKTVKGVGEFDYPDWDVYANPSPCQDCFCLYRLWDLTHDENWQEIQDLELEIKQIYRDSMK